MRSIPPYSHYPHPHMKCGSGAAAELRDHSGNHPGQSVPGARRFPQTAPAAGVTPIDAITTAIGMLVFGALAYFFLAL